MAVYWKPRGWLGRLYMTLITPFRIYLVYPGYMKKVAIDWASFRSLLHEQKPKQTPSQPECCATAAGLAKGSSLE